LTPTVRAGWSRRLALAAAVCVSGTILMRQSAAQAGDIYLPVAIQSGAPTALAIWAAGSAPGAADHQVVLFRTSIEVEPDAAGTGQLAIIADTRYEVFLDGAFVGRGPARFSASLHEYDVLAVELPAGSHWLAVAVQWAPNRRRSESGHPYLLATVRSPGGRLLAATGPDWEALATDAYRPSVQVHADGMIGPAEILDTTRLPPAWRAPSPPVATFPRASIVPRPAGLFRVRSIPPLQTTRLTPALLDSGRLSPGRVMLQAPGSHHVHLDSAASVELETVAPAVRAAINGVPVAWAPEPGRLDVLRR
jgi:alpha-L-rhamnosidase